VVRRQVPVTTTRIARGAWCECPPGTTPSAAPAAGVVGAAATEAPADAPVQSRVGYESAGPGRQFCEGATFANERMVTTTRMVRETQTRRVPYTVTRMVSEQCVKKVPYTVTRMVPHQVTKVVPVTTCRIVKEE